MIKRTLDNKIQIILLILIMLQTVGQKKIWWFVFPCLMGYLIINLSQDIFYIRILNGWTRFIDFLCISNVLIYLAKSCMIGHYQHHTTNLIYNSDSYLNSVTTEVLILTIVLLMIHQSEWLNVYKSFTTKKETKTNYNFIEQSGLISIISLLGIFIVLIDVRMEFFIKASLLLLLISYMNCKIVKGSTKGLKEKQKKVTIESIIIIETLLIGLLISYLICEILMSDGHTLYKIMNIKKKLQKIWKPSLETRYGALFFQNRRLKKIIKKKNYSQKWIKWLYIIKYIVIGVYRFYMLPVLKKIIKIK